MTLSLPADADVSCGLPTATVVLKPKRARPFFGRHPWVLDSALLRVDGKPADGDVVDLTTHDGLFVARGLWNGASKIRVRLYAFNAATKLDTALWRSRLEAAAALRRSLGLDDRGGGCRLVNSEGDDLSGLIVDRYGDWLAGQVTALAKANAELNGAATITVETADAFKKLDALEAVGEPFGMVILDPPKFGCSRASLEEAMRAYHRINRLAVDLLEPGGILVINSCSGAVGRDDFLMMLAGVAQRSGRSLQLIEVCGAAADHPVSVSCLDGEYLKCVIAGVA